MPVGVRTASGAAAADPGPADAIDRKPTDTAGGPVCCTAEVAKSPLQITRVDTGMVGPVTQLVMGLGDGWLRAS